MISTERLKGSWNSVVGAVKTNFAEISGDELQKVQGSAEQLVGLLQRKTGKSREQIESFLVDCCSTTESTINRISEVANEYGEKAGEVVRENYDRLATEAQRGYDYSVKTMQRRPLESVALALGAGLFAGLIFGLSMASRRR